MCGSLSCVNYAFRSAIQHQIMDKYYEDSPQLLCKISTQKAVSDVVEGGGKEVKRMVAEPNC